MDVLRRTTLLLAVFAGSAEIGRAQKQEKTVEPLLRVHGAPSTERLPNVLVLVVDDVGVDMLGVYGTALDPPPTPRMDQLAASGIRFTNAWANPICNTTRLTIQTGRYAFRTPLYPGAGQAAAMPLSEVTLPELLEQGAAGAYSSAYFGKWHLGNPSVGGPLAPNWAGYEHYQGVLGNITAPWSYHEYPLITNGVASTGTVYAPTHKVDESTAWIAEAEDPWLCFVAFHMCHTPWHNPPPGLYTQPNPGPFDPRTTMPDPWFRAMVEALDTEIGRLLDSIDPAVLAETMVFLVGDNGSPLLVQAPPYPSGTGKQTLYQRGVSVPLIVSGPRVKQPGRVVDALVSTADLFTTVADLAGVDVDDVVPEGTVLDSVSLHPYLVDPAAPAARQYVFAEFSSATLGPRWAIRDATHKLISVNGVLELYDLVADPYETHELLATELTPAQAQAFADLQAELAALLASEH